VTIHTIGVEAVDTWQSSELIPRLAFVIANYTCFGVIFRPNRRGWEPRRKSAKSDRIGLNILSGSVIHILLLSGSVIQILLNHIRGERSLRIGGC
jgi:hypothetical protein